MNTTRTFASVAIAGLSSMARAQSPAPSPSPPPSPPAAAPGTPSNPPAPSPASPASPASAPPADAQPAAPAGPAPASPPPPPAVTYGGDLWDRPVLLGDWGGARDQLAAHGFTVDVDATYTYQNLAAGGYAGTIASRFSSETDNGHTFSGDLVMRLDAGKADLMPGAFFTARLEGRTGSSVVRRTGSVSPVNIDALGPNVPDAFDDGVWGLTELTYTQLLSEQFGLVGGLLNTFDGDSNAIAGNARGNATFLNMAMLMSPVETTDAPNVTLGGGLILVPASNIQGSVTAFKTDESATHSPFLTKSGVTIATEWTFKHTLFDQPGGQTVGFMYGINKDRSDIAADPRLVIGSVIVSGSVPTTDKDTWALYYNGYQYIQGDEKHGWGPFVRLGISDGDPNPVRWNVAAGLGGKGLFPGRENDGWGVGAYYIDMSDASLLANLHVDHEIGGEVFYNLALTPAAHLTFDVQVVDQALPHTDTAVIVGARVRLDF